MSESLKSAALWTIGILFFTVTFFVCLICLVLSSRAFTYRSASRLFSILIAIMGIDLKIKGIDHIEKNTAYLIMANHQSLFDLFVIPAAIPIPFVGVEAAYHFKIPLWGQMIKIWGNIPIKRNDLKEGIESIRKAALLFSQGASIAILPEGHRTLTGKMGPFKKGPFHLALNTRATILPVGICGLYQYNSKPGGLRLKPGRVSVTVGSPIAYEKYQELSIEDLRDLVRNEILRLALEK